MTNQKSLPKLNRKSQGPSALVMVWVILILVLFGIVSFFLMGILEKSSEAKISESASVFADEMLLTNYLKTPLLVDHQNLQIFELISLTEINRENYEPLLKEKTVEILDSYFNKKCWEAKIGTLELNNKPCEKSEKEEIALSTNIPLSFSSEFSQLKIEITG